MPDKKTSAYWDEGADCAPADRVATQVHVAENEEWTGLYDSNGRKLMREKYPFGFVPRRDQ